MSLPEDIDKKPVTIGPWKRTSRSLVYSNPWAKIYHDNVIHPDGSSGIYGLVDFQHRALGVVAMNEKQEIILVGQHRYPLDEYSWEIPEGGGRFHEVPLEAIQRELKEETGLEAKNWVELGRVHTSNSICNETGYLWLATGLTEGEPDPDPSEEIATKWVSLEEAYTMAFDSRITDALTVTALFRLQHYLASR